MEIDWEAPETLRLLLVYYALTGQLFWKERAAWMFSTENSKGARSNMWADPQAMFAAQWNKKWAGKPAFTARGSHGHCVGRLNGRNYPRSHIVWAWFYGFWPPPGLEIDHRNGKPFDDRVSNLRLVDQFEQSWNKKAPPRHKHDLPRGVHRQYSGAIFAQIKANGTTHYLGQFDTVKEAHAAYLRAAEELHGSHAFHLSRSRGK